jgi:hypothetical protein
LHLKLGLELLLALEQRVNLGLELIEPLEGGAGLLELGQGRFNLRTAGQYLLKLLHLLLERCKLGLLVLKLALQLLHLVGLLLLQALSPLLSNLIGLKHLILAIVLGLEVLKGLVTL